MSACRVPFHRVFEISKMSFYFTRCIRKLDNHTPISHYTQYVRHNHSIFNAIYATQITLHTRNLGGNINFTILNRIMLNMRLVDK